MSIDTTKKLIGMDYKGTDIKLDQPAVKGLADGTLTEFVASDYGVTSLKDRRFYQFTNLRKLDLTGVTTIPGYTAQGCTGLTELVLDHNTTNIGQYAFQNCSNLKTLTIHSTITNIGQYAFSVDTYDGTTEPIDLEFDNPVTLGSYAFNKRKIGNIKGEFTAINSGTFGGNSSSYGIHIYGDIDIKVNGAIGSGALAGIVRFNSFNFDKNSVVTSIGQEAFSLFGSSYLGPKDDIVLDFRNSVFTNITGYMTFGDNSGAGHTSIGSIYFPQTLTSMGGNIFNQTNPKIYYKTIPTISSQTFNGVRSGIRNFFPYNLVHTAKNSTNWSSSTVVNTIYGYAEENTFNLGDTLPATDLDGYALTWYSDREMTTQVTTVTDPTQIYYCQFGSRIKVKLSATQYQAALTVSDGVNTYTNGDFVSVGANLTLTAAGQGDNTQPYLFTLNGTTIASGDTYTVTTDDINIICVYWDGVNKPFETVFADNTPQQIKVAVDNGLHRTLWTIGDTMAITLTDGRQMTLRYTDGVANRYEKVDGTGYSNSVFELVEFPAKAVMNATGTNSGGWPSSQMNTVTMPQMLALLTQEWQNVISEVKIPSAQSGTSSTIVTANNTVFVPSVQEILLSSAQSYYDEGCTQFDYYRLNNTTAARDKKYNGVSVFWWLRSPSKNNSSYFIYTGTGTPTSYYTQGGVCVCFAI